MRTRPPAHDHKVVCIDFDGTIAPWAPLMDVGAPYPGVVEAILALYDAGYHIVILTSRMSSTWWEHEAKKRKVTPESFGAFQEMYVRRYLDRYGIPYERLTAEKVAAQVYFDDRAWRVAPGELADDLTILLNDGRMDAGTWEETGRE